MRVFSTPKYSGAWFPLDRALRDHRIKIEALLRDALPDPAGKLIVGSSGPEWAGSRTIGISYAHDLDTLLLVWTMDGSPIGVDLESAARPLRTPAPALAERFFHPGETLTLKSLPPEKQGEAFLELWLKKESLAKLTRKGLLHTLPQEVDRLSQVRFEEPALLLNGKRAVLAFYRN
jgi:hypothetical protein